MIFLRSTIYFILNNKIVRKPFIPMSAKIAKCDKVVEPLPGKGLKRTGSIAFPTTKHNDANAEEIKESPTKKQRTSFPHKRVWDHETLTAIEILKNELLKLPGIQLYPDEHPQFHFAFNMHGIDLWLRIVVMRICKRGKTTALQAQHIGIVYILRSEGKDDGSACARFLGASDTANKCHTITKGEITRAERFISCRSDMSVIAQKLTDIYHQVQSNMQPMQQGGMFALIAGNDIMTGITKRAPPSVKDYSTRITYGNAHSIHISSIMKHIKSRGMVVCDLPNPAMHFTFGTSDDQHLAVVVGIPKQKLLMRMSPGVCYVFNISKATSGHESNANAHVGFRLLPYRQNIYAFKDGDLDSYMHGLCPKINGGSPADIANALLRLYADRVRGLGPANFYIKGQREWHNTYYFEQAQPIDERHPEDEEMGEQQQIAIRGTRWLQRLVGDRFKFLETRESAKGDIGVAPLTHEDNDTKTPAYLGLQLKVSQRDGDNTSISLTFTTNAESENSYDGMLMIYISLALGLVWIRPWEKSQRNVRIHPNDPSWRPYYVQRGNIENVLKSAFLMAKNKQDGLRLWSWEELDKSSVETYEIERRNFDSFVSWNGSVFEKAVAYRRYDAIFRGIRWQFKSKDREGSGLTIRLKNYTAQDFDVLVVLTKAGWFWIDVPTLLKNGHLLGRKSRLGSHLTPSITRFRFLGNRPMMIFA